MPWEDRLKRVGSEAPWCSGIIGAALVIWLAGFLGVTAPIQALGGKLDLAHAWRWVSYPLANPMPANGFIWFAIGLFFFLLFISELESRWGSARFLKVFLMVTLGAALGEWITQALMTGTLGHPPLVVAEVWGIRVPAASLFMIWCALNQESTIMLMLVFPIKAKYLAVLDLAWMVFDNRGPAYGLASSLVLLLSWWWAVRYGRALQASSTPVSLGSWLKVWWQSHRKAQRKGRLQVLEGGMSAGFSVPSQSRNQTLRAVTSQMPVKEPDPASLELDRILDKIRFEGMASLTDVERDTLDRQSRRLRGES